MSLFSPRESALERVYVSLDLETTGLDHKQDHIIEVGAVKFRGGEVLETMNTFVNPYTPLSQFIERLTGIRQKDVDSAPPFAAVAGRLAQFVGSYPVVGHNISFDLQFLAKHGLPLSNTPYDTWDLASLFLPSAPEYSLSLLSKRLGIEHDRPHRALSDAQIAREVFLALLKRLEDVDPGVLDQVRLMAERARWSVADLLVNGDSRRTSVGLGGFDLKAVEARLVRLTALREAQTRQSLDEKDLVSMVSVGGLLAREIPNFEHRPQQLSMMKAVVKAFNDGGHVIVEGGTGVGKSVAYLLPAILYAAKNGVRVVVSTNTINLQEQLLTKDIPALARALETGGVLASGEFKATSLKGRANYLCMRRWAALSRSDNLLTDEARLLSKCLVWLQTTATGDKGEINLSGKDAAMWARVSAGDKGKCLGLREGACFLRSARERAEGAHVVVVNHALLLSDMARGGSLIPHYEHLIIDEAHNLEEEATDQLGFSVSQGWLTDQTETLTRWMSDLNLMLRRPSLTDVQKSDLRNLMSDAEGFIPRLRDAWARFWGANEELMQTHRNELNDRLQVRVTRSIRGQSAWSKVEEAWDNVSVALGEVQNRVEKLHRYVSNLSLTDIPEANTLLSNLEAWLEETAEVRGQVEAVLNVQGQEERVDWLAQDNEGSLSLHSAPLDVGARLKAELFDEKKTVVLTSATLSTQGSFEFIRQRLGLEECDELTVGSPFNYKKAALVALPIDLPEPGDRSYKDALERGLGSIVRAAKGHTLALFTSHSSLRAARKTLIDAVEPEGHPVFAQGVDGSPYRVMQQFIENPQGVLLGASSFWEGVDMPSGVVKVLVLVRLPFNVPTDPIFAARSEQYDDSFSQYAVPQAVLRFRQGFGRLIRNSRDRGVVVIMDRRLVSKKYGRTFLESIPECSVRTAPMASITDHISQWLGKQA